MTLIPYLTSRKRARSGGISLIEVVLTMGVAATSLAALAILFVTLCTANESSRNQTKATAHAQVVLEEVRNVSSAAGLLAVTGTNWNAWWNNWAAANAPNLIEPGEEVTVHYVAIPPPDALPAPPPPGPPDPLTVTIRVRWTEKGGGFKRAYVNTMLTRR